MIHLLYDTFDDEKPCLNYNLTTRGGHWIKHYMFNKHCLKKEFTDIVKLHDSSKPLDSNLTYLYLIDLYHLPHVIINDLCTIYRDRIEELFKIKNVHIVIFGAAESYSINYDKINTEFFDMDLSRFWYISGDLNIIEDIDTSNPNSINITSLSIFEHIYKLYTDEQHVKISYNTSYAFPREKEYIFYNGRRRLHRLALFSGLDQENLLKNSFHSLNTNTSDFNEHWFVNNLRDHFTYIDRMWELIETRVMLDVDITDGGDQNSLVANHYPRAYYSIITETQCSTGTENPKDLDPNHLFITEKIWKVIANGHPFMVLGSFRTLEHLKNLGFETFPELFDESYDIEPDFNKRIEIIINNVRNIHNMIKSGDLSKFQAISHKLKHNQELFMRMNCHQKMIDMLEMISSQ